MYIHIDVCRGSAVLPLFSGCSASCSEYVYMYIYIYICIYIYADTLSGSLRRRSNSHVFFLCVCVRAARHQRTINNLKFFKLNLQVGSWELRVGGFRIGSSGLRDLRPWDFGFRDLRSDVQLIHGFGFLNVQISDISCWCSRVNFAFTKIAVNIHIQPKWDNKGYQHIPIPKPATVLQNLGFTKLFRSSPFQNQPNFLALPRFCHTFPFRQPQKP